MSDHHFAVSTGLVILAAGLGLTGAALYFALNYSLPQPLFVLNVALGVSGLPCIVVGALILHSEAGPSGVKK